MKEARVKRTRRRSLDHCIITSLVEPASTVLDLGCGSGELLETLVREKNVSALGIEIDEKAIYQCVARNLSVQHGDVETGLVEYSDKAFDYAILNQSLQQMRKPSTVLREALRVGHKVVVGFPNFAHLECRLQILLTGKTPMTAALPFKWYETPNLHFLSVSDFYEYCQQEQIRILQTAFIRGTKQTQFAPNLLAHNAIFLITRDS